MRRMCSGGGPSGPPSLPSVYYFGNSHHPSHRITIVCIPLLSIVMWDLASPASQWVVKCVMMWIHILGNPFLGLVTVSSGRAHIVIPPHSVTTTTVADWAGPNNAAAVAAAAECKASLNSRYVSRKKLSIRVCAVWLLVVRCMGKALYLIECDGKRYVAFVRRDPPSMV